MDKPIIINIEGYKIIIEKEYNEKTIPSQYTPIQYNQIEIKRKYYKKTDPEYQRKPMKSLKTLKSDKIVKQEPLLEFR